MKPNRHIYAIVLIPILVFLITCNRDSTEIKNNSPLKFLEEKVGKIDVAASDGPFFIKLEDDDRLMIYFLRNLDNKVVILELDPNELTIKNRFFLSRGQGPGEVQNPRIYGGTHNSFLIYDAPAFKFSKYNGSFGWERDYPLNDLGVFLYSGARFSPKKQIVLDGFYKRIDYSNAFFRIYTRKITDQGTINDNKIFEIKENLFTKNKKRLVGKPIHFGLFYDHIYVLDKRHYTIYKMDIEGNIIKKQTVNFPSSTFSKTKRAKWIQENFPQKANRFDYPEELWPACWLMPIRDGIAVGRCATYAPNIPGKIEADFFDKDLKPLGQIHLPDVPRWNDPGAGQIMADIKFIYKHNTLYTAEVRDGENCIVRWRIHDVKN